MSKDPQTIPDGLMSQYFPSSNGAQAYHQHQNKILLQKHKELRNELLITQKLWSSIPNTEEFVVTKRPFEHDANDFNSTSTSKSTLSGKGPEIKLSTAKVFRYRPFSLILTMSSTWRESKGLSYEQVFQAVTALKCRKEGETDEFNICPQCSGKNIIEIGSTNRNSYHPTVSDDKTEMYVFDHCKTNCSSSRDHHRKKLQIVITLDDQKVVTIPFSIQAREKKSSKPKNQNITPHTVQSLVNETILLQQPQQHNTFPIQQFQNQQPNQQLPQQQRQNISDSAEKVIVFVFSTCLTPNDSNELIQNYRSYISKISGYINLRASFIDGLFFIFVYFINVSQTQEYISATRLYLNNEPPFINLYNKKLDSDNIAVLLSSFHNCHEQTQPNISYFNPTY